MLLLLPIALVALVGTILYLLNPEDRAQLLHAVAARVQQMVRDIRHGRDAADPLHEQLLARTRWPIVAPILILGVVWVWAATLFAPQPAAQWQIAWGASYAPRTTNGEWWRLLTYTFVHAGFLHLVATVAALLSLGVTLERIVGRIAFAGVYLAASVAAGVAALWMKPATTVVIGATGALFGLYGLLIAVLVYGYLRKPRLAWSALAAKRVAAGAAVFLLYNLFANNLGTVSALAGLGTGLVLGLSLARRTMARKPRAQRSILVPAVVSAIALAVAIPLRGTIDARPAIARVAAVETWTSLEYAKGVYEVAQRKRSEKTLVQLIDKTIVPALEADRARIEALQGVPREQRPLVAATRDYFTLRERSWRRRQAGVATSSPKILREADEAERQALVAFDRVQRILGTRQTAVEELTPRRSTVE